MTTGDVRLRYLLTERDTRDRPSEQVLSVYRDKGVVPKAEQSDNFNKTPLDLRSYKLVERGDVVVNKMKAWTGSVAVSGYRGIVSGDYLVCEVTGDVHGGFLHYTLRSKRLIDQYIRRSTGIRPQQWRLYWDDFADIAVHLPSISEQRRIADFLDAETARIDALIAAKERMAVVAASRFKSLVVSDLRHAVLAPLKRQATLIDCKHRTAEYVPEGYPVVSPGDVTAGDLDLDRCHRFVDYADWMDLADGPRRPRAGDIVYSRNASVGLAALVGENQEFCMGQDVCLVRTTRADADGRFLAHVLNTVGLDQIEAMKIGSTFFRVNVAQIAELQVPVLPTVEQDNAVRRWDAERRRLDGIGAVLKQQITVLRERRQALITAAGLEVHIGMKHQAA